VIGTLAAERLELIGRLNTSIFMTLGLDPGLGDEQVDLLQLALEAG
jgi:hypothetical protein